MKTKSKSLKIGSFIFYGALTLFVLTFVLSLGDLEEIRAVLKNVSMRQVILATLSILVYVALYPLSLCILTRAHGCEIGMGKTYNIAMTEHFFNGITPFATGGQPFQVYAYNKANVKASQSTGLLLMNFMVFMIVTNSFAACSLFYFSRFVTDRAMAIVAAVGFSINFAVLAMTFLLATSRRVRTWISRLLSFLCRIEWISRLLSPRMESLNEYFEQVQTAFSQLMRQKMAFFLALLSKAVSMAFYYASTFFILRSLGVAAPWEDLFFVICGTSFAITMVVFLPTPGSTGGIEFAFKSVFASIAAGAAASVAYSGMLIWRLISYYLVLFISLGFYILLEILFSKEQKRKENPL